MLLESDPIGFGSLDEAESVLTRAVANILSLLSLRKDVPLAIYQIQIESMKDGAVRLISNIPPCYQDLPDTISMSAPPELMFCAALYREASEAASPMYSFLCLYKVIGTVRAHRTKLAKEGRQGSEERQAIASRERLPDSKDGIKEWISPVFKMAGSDIDSYFGGDRFLPTGIKWGMKFGAVVDTYYKPKRNEIAHAFDDSDLDSLNPDDQMAMLSIQLSLPLLKIIVRMMLLNSFPSFLGSEGLCLNWR